MDERTSTNSSPPATTTANVPAPQAIPTATAPAATTPPEDAEGGAGDEEGIRVPVDLTVASGSTEPQSVAVPAFLPLELQVRSGDGDPHRFRVAGTVLEIPATGTATAQLEGQKRGVLQINVDGVITGEIVVGAEPGP